MRRSTSAGGPWATGYCASPPAPPPPLTTLLLLLLGMRPVLHGDRLSQTNSHPLALLERELVAFRRHGDAGADRSADHSSLHAAHESADDRATTDLGGAFLGVTFPL